MEIDYVSRVLPRCLHQKFSQPHGHSFVGAPGGRLPASFNREHLLILHILPLVTFSRKRGVLTLKSRIVSLLCTLLSGTWGP